MHFVSSQEEVGGSENDEEVNRGLADGPDTSSFTAFLYSFLSSSDTGDNASSHAQSDDNRGAAPDHNPLPDSLLKENGGRKSLFSKSKQSLGRAIRKIGGFRYHDRRDNLEMKLDDGSGSKTSGVVEMRRIEPVQESVTVVPLVDLPEISEPSVLLSDSMRNVLYVSLPPLIHGRKWLLLYRYLIPVHQGSLAATRFRVFCSEVFNLAMNNFITVIIIIRSFIIFVTSIHCLQHLEAWYITFHSLPEKHDLAWIEFAGTA